MHAMCVFVSGSDCSSELEKPEWGDHCKHYKTHIYYHPTLFFPNRVMWVSVLVSDCHPELEKPKLDDNNI